LDEALLELFFIFGGAPPFVGGIKDIYDVLVFYGTYEDYMCYGFPPVGLKVLL
jgi:hypothetical protein